MNEDADIFEQLAAPFPAENISWRVGSTTQDKTKGMALAYIDARDVMERLDQVVGPAGWQRSYPHANGKTVCSIGLKIAGEWIWKADGSGDTDVEAEKGALSDAFKRAAVSWGVGRYLYDMHFPWVPIEPMGRSYKISGAGKTELNRVAESAAANIEWGSPAERAAVKAMVNSIRSMLNTADAVREYRAANDGMIAQLRVKARALVNKALDDIVEASGAVAGDFRKTVDRTGQGSVAGRSTGQTVNA